MIFDLIIILFAVWNAFTVPYEAAYGAISNIFFEVCDRIIDVFFFIDIVVNFRTIYRDSKTDEWVYSFKKIALRYVLHGRFWVDLVASLPVELLELILGENDNLKFIGLVKLS